MVSASLGVQESTRRQVAANSTRLTICCGVLATGNVYSDHAIVVQLSRDIP